MAMATQTYVGDMQTLNPIQVQQTQAQQIQVQAASQPVQSQASVSQTESIHTVQPTPTIIQPAQGSTGQQFIVTIAEPPGEGSQQVQQVQETVQLSQGTTGQVIYQRQPQYVEDSPSSSNDTSATVYAASNGQMQQYTDYTQPAMYTPVTGAYYQASPGSHMTSLTQLGTMQGQIITHGGTYLVQGGAMDTEGHPLTHTTRASPVTEQSSTEQNQRGSHFDVKSWQREVQWLIDNYETAEGVSLPRSTLYNHYLRHCQEQKMDPMNPASFGKLIRSVFLGLRTRRLGTRGNSKYHYYGIRIKATSPLNQYTDDPTIAQRQQPTSQHRNRFKPSLAQSGSTESQDGMQYGGSESSHSQHQQYLGDASGALPNFDEIDMAGEPLPDGVTQEHLRAFEHLFKEHSEAILDIVVNLQFSVIEALWQSFWRNTPGEDGSQENGETDEQHLPKHILYTICNLEPVQKYVRQSDYAFYQALVEVLIPDVLRPIPSSLTQAIRNFAKSLEGWLKGSMAGVPEEMIKIKIGAVSAFAQTLRRYTSLNHLAQAARAVLQNTTQINQMLTDLNRVDFANVQEQASWVCQCEDATVHQLEQDFKKTLQAQNSLEQWAMWLEGVVQQVLKPHEGSPSFPKAARQFLLKWSFYSSMVIRDLTLRSAASFGSFHLIRLLYDEYMFYLVEHKVATATGETPIAVMGEFIDLGNVMSLGTLDSEPATPPKSQPATSVTVVAPASVTAAVVSPNTKIITTVATPNTKVLTTANAKVINPNLAKPITLITTQPTKVIATSQVTSNHNVTGVTHINALSATGATPTKQTFTTLGNAVTAGGQHHLSGVNNANTVTVLAAAAPGGGATPTKRIVVVPVSAAGSGDAQPSLKRVKAE